jgi:hypothetical protein
MKKIFLIPFLLLFFIVTSGQSEQHFKTQKRLISKYKWTHNEKYFQQFVENWKNEVPEIPDSVVANWSVISQNTYQVVQAIFDTTRYIDPKILYDYDFENTYYSYFIDSSYILFPNEMSYEMLRIKLDSCNQDSIRSYLNKKKYYGPNLTFFKPHIANKKTLYLTEWYKNVLIKNPKILKKLNLNDYNQIRQIEAEIKIIKKDKRNKRSEYWYRRILDQENKYDGSYPANIKITFDRTFTYAFVEKMYDYSILVLQKKNGIWYVIFYDSGIIRI